jgi:hypothetical protein
MHNDEPFLYVELGGIERHESGIRMVVKHSGRLEFPRDFPDDGLARAQADLEIVVQKLRENRSELRTLLQAVVSGENAEARRLIGALGLAEADFRAQEGGIFWAIVILDVLCCAEAAY